MHDFFPTPRYTSDEWQLRSVDSPGANKPNCACDLFHDPFTADTWFAWGGFDSEMYAPLNGYLYPLDTVTDLVFWLRWAVCGIATDPESAQKVAKDVLTRINSTIHTIDSAPNGADSHDILWSVFDLVEERFAGFELMKIESIHDYLECKGNATAWSGFLKDNVIRNENGVWSMSEVGWGNLTEQFRSAGFEAVFPEED